MIKHIVMWQVEAKEGLAKQDILETLKKELEGLAGQIEGLTKIEVGLNYNTSDTAYDAVLYSEFVNKEALAYYQKHEKHQYVANHYVRPYTVARAVVDYEF
ncbi:MAG: Dabb family protein [Cellulosilyticaceae bacterium]